MDERERAAFGPAVVVAVVVGALAVWHGVIDTGDRTAGDLATYQATAKVWLDGGDPRACGALKAVAEARLGGCAVSPAWLTIALAPLGLTSVAALTTPWRAAGAALVALAAGLWTVRAARPWRAAAAVIGAAVVLRATLSTLAPGNLEPLVVALLGAGAAWPRGRAWLVAAAGAVKVQPWALAPVVGARPSALAFGLMVLTDLAIDGAALVGPRAAAVGDSDAVQPTLLGVVHAARGATGPVGAVDLALWLLLAAPAVALAAWRLRRSDAEVRFRLAALGLLVLSPRGWHYIWLGAVGPVGVTWAATPYAVVGALGLLLPSRTFAPWAVAVITWVVGLALARPLAADQSVRSS